MTVIENIVQQCGHIKALRDEQLRKHTTFAIGGPVPLMILPQSGDELLAALSLCRNAGVPYFVLGNGSNILAADGAG